MTRRYRRLTAVLWQCLVLLLWQSPALAASNNIVAELVAEGPASPGGTTTLAIHMRPAPGWHGYWVNPGDAGLGMELDWTLPQGAKPGEPRYPVPQVLFISGLMNHIYESDYAVLVPLTLPGNASPGARLPIAVNARWLACTDEICVPEGARLETTVMVGRGGTADPRFDDWRAKLPAPLGAEAEFAVDGETVRLGIPLPADLPIANPHFFAAEDRVVDYAAPQVFRRKDDTLIVELRRPALTPTMPTRLSGVLSLDGMGTGLEVVAAPGQVPKDGTPVAATAPERVASLPLLLLGALVGGLLLNIMPCVFPILSLKALSLARAGESEAQARAEGIAYTAGVVLACLCLGGLLLALRAAGEQVGWAFQLQEPGVVAALVLLTTALTANFLGLFEFAVPGFARAGAPQGAFATGLLAAFVATPCTGPFMAAAMGAALLLPLVPALALFAALGLGLALPFLALAFVPGLRRRLPRPGPWMVRFRRWMALPMGLTALALLWLASRLGGNAFGVASAGLAALLLVALAWAGARQRQGKPATLPSALGLLLTGALAITVLPRVSDGVAAQAESLLPTRPFSPAALAEARAAGKPVFAWFTADWCLTCKVNERVAIERETVREAFEDADVVVLRGDWTRRDPVITRFLTQQGAAGVPLYIWYPADGSAPRQLPQVLTPDSVVDLTKR